jgi:prepilin signal peptidase PulO-like enzyme (type II secretory pathway)
LNRLLLPVVLVFGIPACVSDLKSMTIPDHLSIGGAIMVLAIRIVLVGEPLFLVLADCLGGGLVFLVVRMITRGKLGWGDIKWAFFLSAALGFFVWLEATGIAVILVMIYYIFLSALKKGNKSTKIPFCPFLTVGAVIRILLER